ncbi:MAG: hypothetical protein LBP19_06230 [Treponema sp.]|jgi:hypothetical protein|nr:hypothetical protein [Treponema sp.]
MDSSNIFDTSGDNQGTFIKTSEKIALNSTQKAVLNRKGNILYNSGDIEGAKRIFLTTGYSDGLVRIGNYYKTKGRLLDALRMYWIAPDHTKVDSIVVQLSEIIKELIYEGDRT